MPAERYEWNETDFVGGAPCLDFINTVSAWREGRAARDKFGDHIDILRWSEAARLLSPVDSARLARATDDDSARRFLEKARALRLVLHHVVTAFAESREPRAADLETLGRLLSEAHSMRRLAWDKDGVKQVWPETAALERCLWPVLISAETLLLDADPARIRSCPGESCGWVFLDASKSGRRRWCDMRVCGNREKAARHYARRRKTKRSPRINNELTIKTTHD